MLSHGPCGNYGRLLIPVARSTSACGCWLTVSGFWVLTTLTPLLRQDNLADAYLSAGRLEDAIPLFEKTLGDRQRVLGADHLDTLTSRNNLAYAYRSAGRQEDAIPLFEQNLTDCERVLDRKSLQAAIDRARARG